MVASGQDSFQVGIYATASGTGSAIVGGSSNTASGQYSGIIAASNSVASGQRATVIAGTAAQATANSGIAYGEFSLADRIFMQAHSGGRFSAVGDAQRARFVLRNKTTNDTATELFLNGSSVRLTIPSGKYLTGTINIAGIKSDGSAAASYIRQFSIKNVAATTSLVGTVNTIGTDEVASTSIAITADDTNDALDIAVTGIASETWRWAAVFNGIEIAYGT